MSNIINTTVRGIAVRLEFTPGLFGGQRVKGYIDSKKLYVIESIVIDAVALHTGRSVDSLRRLPSMSGVDNGEAWITLPINC